VEISYGVKSLKREEFTRQNGWVGYGILLPTVEEQKEQNAKTNWVSVWIEKMLEKKARAVV